MTKFIFGLLLLAALALSSCAAPTTNAPPPPQATAAQAQAPTAGPPQAPAGPVTIRVWSFLDPDNGKTPRDLAIAQIIKDFEVANPEIKVKVEPQPWDQLDRKFLAGAASGDAPDMVWLTFNIYEAATGGLLADLDKVFTPEEKASFSDAVYQGGYVQGTKFVQVIPSPGMVIFYRKDLFSAAGIDPKSIKTWDSFVSAAQKLTVDKNNDGVPEQWGFGQNLAPAGQDYDPFHYCLIDLKGALYDIKNKKTLFDTPEGVWCLQLTVDMMGKNKVTPKDAITYTSDDVQEQFSAGRYAMAKVYAPRYTKVQSEAKWDPKELGVMPWPTKSGTDPAPAEVEGWQLGIWSGSKHPVEAGKFFGYFFSSAGQLTWAKIGGQIPAVKTLSEDPFFKDPANAYIPEMVQLMSSPKAYPQVLEVGGYGVTVSKLNEAAARVLNGSDPMDELKKVDAYFQEQQK